MRAVGLYIIYNQYWVTGSVAESIGGLVQDNIFAPDGTYPDNGKHKDGYWYIK